MFEAGKYRALVDVIFHYWNVNIAYTDERIRAHTNGTWCRRVSVTDTKHYQKENNTKTAYFMLILR